MPAAGRERGLGLVRDLCYSRSTMKKLALALAALCLAAAAPTDAQAQARTRITVYSTLELDQLNVYKKTFEAAHPEIEIAFLKDATGVVTARILAEKDAPQADAVWGLAVT